MQDGTTIDLLRAVRAGDSAAWANLDERIRKALRLAVRGQVPPSMRAQFDTEVLLQSAIVGAYQALDSYEYQGKGSLQAWLRTIFQNKLRARVRQLRTSRREVAREAGRVHEGLASEHASPEQEIVRAEQFARLMTAFASLPSKEGKILTSFYFDKKSAVELARERNTSESTVRRELALAIERLHAKLRASTRDDRTEGT